MKIFLTFNPHIENLSQKRLFNDFRYALQKYYREDIGRRYYNYIDNQYDIAVFEEIGKKFYEVYDSKTQLIKYIDKKEPFKKEPHLHIITDVPANNIERYCEVLRTTLESNYPSLATRAQLILTKKDEINAYNYCSKEGGKIYSKRDLTEKEMPLIDSTSGILKYISYF